MGDPTPVLVPEVPSPEGEWGQDRVLVSRVHVTVGDRVASGQPLADLETDKVSLELASPVSGVVSDVRVRWDDTVPLGAVLMIIDTGASPTPADTGIALRVPNAPGRGAEWGHDRVTVAEVHVSAGSRVEGGQPVVAVSTSRTVQGGNLLVTLQMTSLTRGSVGRVRAAVGSTMAVGSVLLFIEPELPLTSAVVPQAPSPDGEWGQDQVLVSRVHVTVGDRVASGQPLADLETDKVSLELASPVSGVVCDLKVSPDDTVPVGAVLMLIDANA